MGGELGDYSHQTFQHLYDRLKKFKVLFYCSDRGRGFHKVIDPQRLYQGKGKRKTYRIEQNNSRQKHRFARFERRSTVVSRSIRMIRATMGIFTAIANITFNPIIKLKGTVSIISIASKMLEC